MTKHQVVISALLSQFFTKLKIKIRMKIDQAGAVRAGENLDSSVLEKIISANVPDFTAITEIKQFGGGFSNLTYLISTENKAYVLRRPPFGAVAKGGHDMAREFRVLSLLKSAGFDEVPTPLSIFDENEGLNAPFYLMEKLEGVILRSKDGQNPELTPDVMARLSEKLINQLADLHNLDLEKTGLAQLGKPEGYVLRQTTGWIDRYEKSQTDDIADMIFIAEWLQKNQPKPQKPAFLHNDFKFDNVVWREDLSEIVGILDWEMSTVGDPLMDLGAALAYWCEVSDSDFSKMFNITWREGCLSRCEVVAQYADLTGRDVSDILFYYVFGLYKNAVIVQQIYARWKKGLTQDARFSQLIQGVFALSKTGREAIETGKI